MSMNNYKRTLLAWGMALLFTLPAMGQLGELRNELAVGFNAGMNMSKVDFSPRIKMKNQNGMSMGITVRYMCEKYFKMMCGILYPTSGSVLVNGMGFENDRQKINKEMGVVFGQKTQLWWDIPLIETFKILKSIYEVPDDEYNERFEYLCELLDMKPFLTQTVRSLSLGQRMRADFAAALIHSPKIVYLDEPTIGLDVLVKDKIRSAIKELNKKYNITVILTTHDMKDIEELCNRIIIIDKGKILYDGSLSNIKYRFGNTKTIYIPSNLTFDEFDLKSKFSGIILEKHDETTAIKFSLNEIDLDDVLIYLINTYHIKDFKIEDISIEDITKKLYEKH